MFRGVRTYQAHRSIPRPQDPSITELDQRICTHQDRLERKLGFHLSVCDQSFKTRIRVHSP